MPASRFPPARALVAALVSGLVLASCSPTVPVAPAATLPATSAAASPAPPPATSGPAASAPVAPEAAEIQALLDVLAGAVIAGDRESYLALVDTREPVFATEHSRWVDDWVGLHPVEAYSAQVADLERAPDASMTGTLTVTWRVEGEPEERQARYVARFTDDGSGWRYAGEAWSSTEIEKFLIRVAPGLEAAGQGIADDLPAIYDDVTAALGHKPAGTLEIKLYADSPSLVVNTLLSLPDIAGWNEPGEALKLVNPSDGPPLAPTIAHEMTHFIGFDRAGTKRTRMPWWLDEGIATYVGSQVAGTPEDGRLAQVVAWEADGELAPWEQMEIFEETPLDLWRFVYSQGYALVRFVTEELGVDRRNAWLAAMATEMDIRAATRAELGRTFDELDAAFRDWLVEQG